MVKGLLGIIAVLFFVNTIVYAKEQPNIVVILADDIGVGDISFYNQNMINKKVVVSTPNIDALAQQGVWFTDAHSATALCAPTRYAVMTGKNNYRSYAPWGVWGTFQPNAIKVNEPTLANVVKTQGYSTGFVGKWHLGGDYQLRHSDKVYRGTDERRIENIDLSEMVAGGPNDLGFDYSYMLPDGIQGPIYLAYENQHWAPLEKSSKIIYINKNTASNPAIVSDKGAGMGDSHWKTSEMGDRLSKKAVDFIKSQKHAPFMLYYASPMAHKPHIPPAFFDNIKVKGSTPSRHLDMVFELDLQVGRIIDALKSQGVYENTLIIFTSDNGGLVYKVPGTLESGHNPSGIYRGSKNQPHEGGHRVPFIVTWPKQNQSVGIEHTPILVQDILATIAQASGRNLTLTEAPDSQSILPLIFNRSQLNSTSNKSLASYNARKYMMLQGGSRNELIYREGDWKLIIQSNYKVSQFKPVALFNLKDNVQERESQNLINKIQYKDKILSMLEHYISVRNSKKPTVVK